MKFNRLVSLLTIVGLLVLSPGAALVSAQEPTDTPTEEVAPAAEPTEEVTPTVEATLAATEVVTPTEEVTEEPTEEATVEPTVEATVEPTEEVTPTVEPTVEATVEPTEEVTPTVEPTVEATVEPTEEVTPTVEPTEEVTPTVEPTVEVTATVEPTATPTVEPTVEVTPTETITPTAVVTETPTVTPTVETAGEINAQAAAMSSIVYVQNTVNAQNTIGINWYNTNGTEAATATSATLAPYGRGAYQYPGGDGFQGSAVVGAEEPVVAMARLSTNLSSNYGKGSGYMGSSVGGRDVFLPSVHRSSWQTWVAVQSLAGTASITLTVYNASGGVVMTVKDSIPVNASHYFDFNNYTALGSSFSGSARVQASADVYVIVREEWASTGSQVAYEGIPTSQSATTLYFPTYNRNMKGSQANGWNTTLLIQNTESGGNASVTVTFKDANGATARTLTGSIPPNSSWYITGATEPSTRNAWNGSAYLTSNRKVVAISGYQYSMSGTRAGYGYYAGVSSGTKSVFSPCVRGNWNGSAITGPNTNLLIQNLNLSQTASFTATYRNASGATVATYKSTIPPGSNVYIAIANSSLSALWNGFDGTVQVTANQNIAAAALDTGLGSKYGQSGFPADTLSLFNLANQ